MKGAGWRRLSHFESRSWRLKIGFPMWDATERRLVADEKSPGIGYSHTL